LENPGRQEGTAYFNKETETPEELEVPRRQLKSKLGERRGIGVHRKVKIWGGNITHERSGEKD